MFRKYRQLLCGYILGVATAIPIVALTQGADDLLVISPTLNNRISINPNIPNEADLTRSSQLVGYVYGDIPDSKVTESSVTQHEGAIDHDALLNFVANEHIDHTAVTLTAGVGLSGGGDISASRSFDVDLNELTTETSIAAGDYISMVDITDNGSGKITFANFESALSFVTSEVNDLSSVVTWANVPNANITQGSVTQHQAAIDHDALTNFVSDEHVAHSGVTLTAGTGLSGGGTIAASRTFAVDLNELTTETSIASGDFIAMVDITDSGSGKITLSNFSSSLTIPETSITDGSILARLASNETITGQWSFDNDVDITGGADFSINAGNDAGNSIQLIPGALTTSSASIAGPVSANLNIYSGGGSNNVQIINGSDLRVYDGVNSDYISLAESGSQATIEANTNPLVLGGQGTGTVSLTSSFASVFNGASLRVYNSGGTDYADFDHDGTDFILDFTNTDDFKIQGANSASFRNASNVVRFMVDHANSIVRVYGGYTFRIYNSGNTDYGTWDHDGTDFNLDLTNTTDYNITGLSGNLATEGDVYVTNTSPAVFWYESDGATNEKLMRATNSAGVWSLATRTDASGTGENAIVVNRSGTAVTDVTLVGDEVSFNGVPDFAGGTSSTASAGAQTLPSNPVGFINIEVGGTSYRLPYYSP